MARAKKVIKPEEPKVVNKAKEERPVLPPEPTLPIVLGTYDGKTLYCSACMAVVNNKMIDYGIEEIQGKTEYFYIRVCSCGCVVKAYSMIGAGKVGKPTMRVDLGVIPARIITAKLSYQAHVAAEVNLIVKAEADRKAREAAGIVEKAVVEELEEEAVEEVAEVEVEVEVDPPAEPPVSPKRIRRKKEPKPDSEE